jgi:hypothetical protein
LKTCFSILNEILLNEEILLKNDKFIYENSQK